MEKEKYIPLMERNYDSLKGSDIVVCYEGREFDGIVPGCDPKRGISIVSADNPDKEFICLNYKIWLEHGRWEKNYTGAFACMVRKIKRGRMDVNLPDRVYARDKKFEPPGFGVHPCSFK